MSAEVDALDRHTAKHGCGDPTSPNFNGGVFHCAEAMALWDAIDHDDPDYPVVLG
jgi:hypothetical protein